MPWPLIAGAVLAAGGAGLGIKGISDSKKAMEHEMRKALAKQAEYQYNADAIYNRNLALNGPVPAQESIDRGTARATSAYNNLSSIPFESSTSKALSSGQQKRSDQSAQAYDRLIGAPNAHMMGITNYDIERWINNLKASTLLNNISGQANQANSALAYNLQSAQNEGSTLQGIGSLLGSVGGAIGTYGAGQNSYNKGYDQALTKNPFHAQTTQQNILGQLPFFPRG